MPAIDEQYLLSFVPERFLKDERYRNGHIHILAPKEGTRILGMHTPEMKRVAKELIRDDCWEQQLGRWQKHFPLTGQKGLTHEERMIWGLVIDYAKIALGKRLQLLDDFIQAIDNWAICDNLCCNAKWVEKEDKKAVWDFIRKQLSSEDEFRARVGLILSLAHFLDADNVRNTLETVAKRRYLDSDPYYIRMGTAWLFAEGLCKQYDTALEYIESHKLSRWIHNKAIQKARESWRITPERKEYLQSLKIK